MTKVVKTKIRGGIAWITLNRPEAMNAISNAVRSELPAAVKAASDDPEVRVVIFSGAGEKAFCAGADIKEFTEVPSPLAWREDRVNGTWITELEKIRKPTIAAIHGYCLGGGLEIALACDIRIATRDARLGLPEVRVGVITGIGGSQRLRKVVGLGRALDMMLTGDHVDAQEAYQMGLVSRLAESGKHLEIAEEVGTRIAGNAPLATAAIKEVLREGGELPLADGKRLELDLLALLQSSEDRLEAAAAFKEKRKPNFKGR